jgi:hypothetical protein
MLPWNKLTSCVIWGFTTLMKITAFWDEAVFIGN